MADLAVPRSEVGPRRPGVPPAKTSLTTAAAVTAWFASLGMLAVSVGFMIRVRRADVEVVGTLGPGPFLDAVMVLAVVTLGSLIVLRGRSVRYGWLMLAFGTVASLVLAAGEVALHGWYVGGSRTSSVTEAAIWAQDAIGLATLPALVLWLPSLFPDGHPVGRWLRPVRWATVAWAVWAVCFAFVPRAAENYFLDHPDGPDNPAGVLPAALHDPVLLAWVVLMVSSAVISIGSVWTRWQTSDAEERLRLKWVLFALAVVGFVMLLSVAEGILADPAGGWITSTGAILAWVGVLTAIGMTLLRHRLYDVDLVVNRTVVYAAMSLVVVVVYAVVVTGVAAVLPDVTDAGASLVAAGVVALAFAPVRSEVQRGVDRWMFGRRSDPIGVIADVGSSLASTDAPDAALRAIADTVVSALKLPGAAIVIGSTGERPAVTAGVLGGAVEELPLRYQGRDVGRLQVARRSPSEALSASDHRLLDNVAHYTAGVVHTLELNQALQRSRERLVVAREEERRRLRRDLHDGLGPSLASQMFRLDAALAHLDDDAEVVADHLRALKLQNRELVADIRRLVYELRPPALDELGLAGAIASYAGQFVDADLTVSVTATPDPLGELPAAVEAAGYRIVAEAVANTVRHAGATRCHVAIERRDHLVTVVVTDDGTGVPSRPGTGIGFGSMRERAAELGGSLTIAGGPNGGTRVTAELPTGTVLFDATRSGAR